MTTLFTLLHLLQLYILSYFIFLFLMYYVPFVLATVVPDDDGQRGHDDKVEPNCHTLRYAKSCPLLCLNNF